MASTTVFTSLEQDSMMMCRAWSTCIIWRSVARPSISGIRTSRITKSGRAWLWMCSRASAPEPTAVTWKPSTSSSVCRYLRMLGSSSTTRTRSCSDIFVSLLVQLNGVGRQQHGERAAAMQFAVYPDLAPMRLDQPVSDGQTQAHPGGTAVHAHEVFKNFLVMLRGDSGAGVGHRDAHGIGGRAGPAAPVGRRNVLGAAPFPEMRSGGQGHAAARGCVLQRVVHQIGHHLLHLLIVEAENGNGLVH